MPLHPQPLSSGTQGTAASMPSKAPHPPRWHPAAEVVKQRSSLAHHGLATVPKVTQSALEWSQTVEPRPEIKKTAREEGRGGKEGRRKRGKRRRAFSLFIQQSNCSAPLLLIDRLNAAATVGHRRNESWHLHTELQERGGQRSRFMFTSRIQPIMSACSS